MTVVVGVDGSRGSIDALRWAVEEGRLRRTPVRAVHCWTVPTSNELSERAAKITLDHVLAEIGNTHGVELSGDALVVGSRGRGGLKALLLRIRQPALRSPHALSARHRADPTDR